MKIVDFSAWTGHWGSFPVPGSVEQVRDAVRRVGVERICLAPLDAVWGHNPHVCNEVVYQAARRHADITAVPVIDPTIATWEGEVQRAVEGRAGFVKLCPAYSGYSVDAAADLFAQLADVELPVMVQVRIEDARRNHPLAVVADVAVDGITAMAQRYRELTVIVGGAATASLLGLAQALPDIPNLFADISQADGMDALQRLVDAGLGERLLFGTHAPLFEPLGALARVLPELDDGTARAILSGNAAAILHD
jgi:predicted TIM-barrel fold metal-dependent hydrolase